MKTNDGQPLFSAVHKAFDPWWKRWPKRVWHWLFPPKFNESNLVVGMDFGVKDESHLVIAKRDPKGFIEVMFDLKTTPFQDRIIKEMQNNQRMTIKPLYIPSRRRSRKSVYEAMMEQRAEVDRNIVKAREQRILGKFEDV